MTGSKRRSYEPGHRPKFLVFVDDTPECDRAIRFASRRVARTGAALLLIAVTPPVEAQEWIGVADMMQAEETAKATERLQKVAGEVRALAGIEAETACRVGNPAREIVSLIETDEDIALLILAAGTGGEGPGPLVTNLAGRQAAGFPIPIVIVPGGLEDSEIDALA